MNSPNPRGALTPSQFRELQLPDSVVKQTAEAIAISLRALELAEGAHLIARQEDEFQEVNRMSGAASSSTMPRLHVFPQNQHQAE
jgi:hypothetical protein